MSPANEGMIEGPIAVDGATGYLGSHLIDRLGRLNCRVAALVHPGAGQKDIEIIKSTGAQVVTADLSLANIDATAEHLRGCKTVVHLIGSVAPKKGVALSDLHVGQTRNLVEACRLANVGRLVMVTTLGARSDADNIYQSTKSAAEEVVKASGLNYTILRPPLLIGRTFGQRDSKLVRRYREMIVGKKVVLLINGGKNKLQPLFIDDIVSAICKCLANEGGCERAVLEVGGPEVIDMRQFVEMLMETCKLHKPIVSLPPMLATVAAAFCELIQDVPMVSSDQVKLALADNICVDNAMVSKLKLELTPVKRALDSYNTDSAQLSILS